MDYIFPLILLVFFVIFIGGAYYLDYKSDPKEFKYSLKSAAKGLKRYFISSIGLTLVYFVTKKIIDLIF